MGMELKGLGIDVRGRRDCKRELRDQDFHDESNFKLEEENRKLKDQMSKMKTIIKNLDQKPKGKRPMSAAGKGRTGAAGAPGPSYQGKLIEQLKKKLVETEAELQRVVREKSGSGGGGAVSGELYRQMREKELKLQSVQSRFDVLEGSFRQKERMFENTKELLDQSLEELKDKNTDILKLKSQLMVAQSAAQTAKDLERQLQDSLAEKQSMQTRIIDLCETPFFKNAGAQNNTWRRLQETEKEITELKILNQRYKDIAVKTGVDTEKQVEQLRVLEQERDLYRDQNMQMKVRYEGSGLNPDDIQRLLKENDPSKFRAEMEKLHYEGQEPIWARLDFLERPGDFDDTDPKSLRKEIERLQMEKAQLASELEKAQMQLKIRMDIERDNKSMLEGQVEELKLKLKAGATKATEYEKLAEFRGQRIGQLEKTMHKGAAEREMRATTPYGEPLRVGEMDAMSEFSEISHESELRVGENRLDVWIGQVELHPNSLVQVLDQADFSISSCNIVTFLTLDFYNHDTQATPIMEGLNPNYNVQLAFKVNVDDFFLQYVEKDALYLDVYMTKGRNSVIIGRAKVFLYDLLERSSVLAEAAMTTPAVDTMVPISSSRISDVILGSVRVKLRFRHPITEALRWLKERNNLLSSSLMRTTMPRAQRKIVVVHIQKCENLRPAQSSLSTLSPFVYYQFYNCPDKYTKTSFGTDPVYDDTQTFTVIANNAFANYLEMQTLELLVFDDNAPLDEAAARDNRPSIVGPGNDLLGTAKLPLKELIRGNIIDETTTLYDPKGIASGIIKLKITTFEAQEERPSRRETKGGTGMKLSTQYEEEILKKLCFSLKERRLDLDVAFRIFDLDHDSLISKEDFRVTVLQTFNTNITQSELELFLEGDFFRERIDQGTFKQKLGPIYAMTNIPLGRFGEDTLARESLDFKRGSVYGQGQGYGEQGPRGDKLQEIFNKIKIAKVSHVSLSQKFKVVDERGVGEVEEEDFKYAIHTLHVGLNAQELELLVLNFQNPRNKRVIYTELLDQLFGIGKEEHSQVAQKMRNILANREYDLYTTFAEIDQNKDGLIQYKEFLRLLQRPPYKFTPREIEQLWDMIEKKKQNSIDYVEFIKTFDPEFSQGRPAAKLDASRRLSGTSASHSYKRAVSLKETIGNIGINKLYIIYRFY